MEKFFIPVLLLLAAIIILLIFMLVGNRNRKDDFKREVSDEINAKIELMTSTISQANMQINSLQDVRIKELSESVYRSNEMMRKIVSENLEHVRSTVDEKLDKTLNTRLSESFDSVNRRLAEVHKGLGQMQSLAEGVGDLKKVLSNVKTRGIVGELQLGALLGDVLAPGQYLENTPTVPNSSDRVEFAIKFPGLDENHVLLPVDSKFPQDIYERLLSAQKDADKDAVLSAEKEMVKTIKVFAKTIRDKYVKPPFTTDFAIMFLPFEGLYAEVIRLGMVQTLQNEYKICIAGPTTMAVLLNSLNMGFKSVAIQKRSGEVWQILANVKTEFENFANVLEKTQQRLNQANSELDALVGVRTRKIQKTLSKIEMIEDNGQIKDEE